jgi:hypothetical protein
MGPTLFEVLEGGDRHMEDKGDKKYSHELVTT